MGAINYEISGELDIAVRRPAGAALDRIDPTIATGRGLDIRESDAHARMHMAWDDTHDGACRMKH